MKVTKLTSKLKFDKLLFIKHTWISSSIVKIHIRIIDDTEIIKFKIYKR